MLQAFVYNEVAVLVRHWFEIDLHDSHLEHGARVELRLLAPEPHRGSESAAQRVTPDRPLWRADLFDRLDGTVGGFDAAHFHPRFDGVEPCKRNWAEDVKSSPWTWLERQLKDVPTLVTAAGGTLRDPEAEGAEIAGDTPQIVAAAQARAAEHCRTKERCHAWTRDVTHAVDLMLGSLDRPDLLDRERVSPWLA